MCMCDILYDIFKAVIVSVAAGNASLLSEYLFSSVSWIEVARRLKRHMASCCVDLF